MPKSSSLRFYTRIANYMKWDRVTVERCFGKWFEVDRSRDMLLNASTGSSKAFEMDHSRFSLATGNKDLHWYKKGCDSS